MTRVVLIGWLALAGTLAQAAAPPQPPADPSDPRTEVVSHLPGAKVDDLRASPIKGMYEYTRGTDIAYVTADGKYAINGDLYDIAADNNLTEVHRRELRNKLMAAYPEDQMLVFGPKDAEVHHHGVHRRRLRLLPQAPQPDRRLQQARDPRALPALPAHRPQLQLLDQGRAGVVLDRIATMPSPRPSSART